MQIREIIETRTNTGAPRGAFGGLRSTLKHLKYKAVINAKNIKLPKAKAVAKEANNVLIAFLKSTKKKIKDTPKDIWDSSVDTVRKYKNYNYNRKKFSEFQYARWEKLKEIEGIRWREWLAYINKFTLGQNPYSYWHLYLAKPAMLYFNYRMFVGALKVAKEDLGPFSALALSAASLQIPFDFFVMSKGRMIFDTIVFGDMALSGVKGFFKSLLGEFEYEYTEDIESSTYLNQKADATIMQYDKIATEQLNNTLTKIAKVEQAAEHFYENPQDIEGAENYLRATYPELPEDYISEFTNQFLNDASEYYHEISKELEQFRKILGAAV